MSQPHKNAYYFSMENVFKNKAINWNIQVDNRKLKTDLFALLIVCPSLLSPSWLS